MWKEATGSEERERRERHRRLEEAGRRKELAARGARVEKIEGDKRDGLILIMPRINECRTCGGIVYAIRGATDA